MTNLTPLVCQVHQLRQEWHDALRKRNDAYEAWRTANAGVIDAEIQAKNVLALAEEALRDSVVAAYVVTGSKTPGPGVGIRVVTRLEYDSAVALAWAKEHDIALALDKAAFEKVAKASPLTFVRSIETPTATIATDLGKALEAAKTEEDKVK